MTRVMTTDDTNQYLLGVGLCAGHVNSCEQGPSLAQKQACGGPASP